MCVHPKVDVSFHVFGLRASVILLGNSPYRFDTAMSKHLQGTRSRYSGKYQVKTPFKYHSTNHRPGSSIVKEAGWPFTIHWYLRYMLKAKYLLRSRTCLSSHW